MRRFSILLALGAAACATGRVAPMTPPVADHHQHLFSPATAALIAGENSPQPVSAADVLALLDSAGIRRAVVLSTAYMWARPGRQVENEYEKVRADNDWTAAQAAAHPDRLIAFCSVNPLEDYAVAEVRRCAATQNIRRGLKLHLGNSDVQLDDPGHLAQLKSVFRTANEHRMAIVVHLRASISRRRPYGAAQARIFLDELLPLVPDVPVQVAHLAGTGPGYDDPPADSALAVLAEAVERGDSRTRRLWFDVTSVVERNVPAETAALIVRRIRQVGVGRVLYGTDSALGDNLRPRESWQAFRQLPLTEAEFAQIARNVAPYFP